MAENTDAKIVIGGKTLLVSSEESADHLQQVADYVNKKIEENKAAPGYEKMPVDTRFMLLELNIGDDYVSTKAKFDDALIELAKKNKELYEIKQAFQTLKKNYEIARNQVIELQSKAADNAAKIIKLETELKKK